MTTSFSELNYEQLVEKKSEIESELDALNTVLLDEKNVGMEGALVDSEGYPRSDIDIYKVRLARQRINCLRNNYKALMGEIEKKLPNKLHSSTSTTTTTSNGSHQTHQQPILKVTQLDRGSPADEAGMMLNDEIVQFGPFVRANFNLAELADHVKSHKDKIVLVKLRRRIMEDEFETKIVKLVPKVWSGHGLLGCKINPI